MFYGTKILWSDCLRFVFLLSSIYFPHLSYVIFLFLSFLSFLLVYLFFLTRDYARFSSFLVYSDNLLICPLNPLICMMNY
jgi:hypothetical protein